MCSECGDDEPECSFCGAPCYGSCDDPDSCPCCWMDQNEPEAIVLEFDDGALEACMDSDCSCVCHDEFYGDIGLRTEAGVRVFEEEDGPPFVREGVFPFLKLAGELREKIYGFAFLQDGNQRKSEYHRGTIHTALLRTCRQIYKEAATLPLTTNTLNFKAALWGLNYLGFFLRPGQHDLITSIHVELHHYEFSNLSWELLFRQLAKLPIFHLGLTIKGRCSKEMFLGHSCFIGRFKEHLEDVKSFDLFLGSVSITEKVKEEIQEEMRVALIKGYKPPKKAKAKPKTKRDAPSETGDSQPAKRVKKAAPKIKQQAKLFVSPKTSRVALRSQNAEKDHTRQTLLAQYEQLKQYATATDRDTAPVKIRLECAYKAADNGDETKFAQFWHDVLETLEERYNQITAARKSIPTLRKPAPKIFSMDSDSSQSSHDSLNTVVSSQLSD